MAPCISIPSSPLRGQYTTCAYRSLVTGRYLYRRRNLDRDLHFSSSFLRRTQKPQLRDPHVVALLVDELGGAKGIVGSAAALCHSLPLSPKDPAKGSASGITRGE